jgi:inhibitor of cysteine peptidase
MITARIATIASLSLLAACAPSAGRQTAPAVGDVQAIRDGRTLLRVGQTLLITLPSNATTGYSWTLSGGRIDVLAPGSPFGEEITDPHAAGMVGVGGVTSWRFLAAQPGTATLTFRYGRAWEPDARPAETATYAIAVR